MVNVYKNAHDGPVSSEKTLQTQYLQIRPSKSLQTQIYVTFYHIMYQYVQINVSKTLFFSNPELVLVVLKSNVLSADVRPMVPKTMVLIHASSY